MREIDASTVRVSPLRVPTSSSMSRTNPSRSSSSSIARRRSGRSQKPTSIIDRPTNPPSCQPSISRHAGLANRITPSAARVIAVGTGDASKTASMSEEQRGAAARG